MEDEKKQIDKTSHIAPEGENSEEIRGILYIGIDLGTSRTSIASSNGIRESMLSVVGYPKDMVSRKFLKHEAIFGEDAIRHRLSLDIYRPLEKGVIEGSDGHGPYSEKDMEMNLNAVRDLVKHAISLSRPRNDELIYGVIGCPARSSIKNKSYLIEVAKEQMDSVMICSETFAVAYGMDWLKDLLVIDIGAGTVDLCRMQGTLPREEDQITLETAGDYIEKELARLISQTYPEAQFSDNMIKGIKERHATVMKNTPPIKVEFPVQGRPQEFDITKEMNEACRSIIPPIVASLGRLTATLDAELQMCLKNNVLLSGGGGQIRGLVEAIEKDMKEGLGHGRVIPVSDPIYAGSNGALKIAYDMPLVFWDQFKEP